MAGTWLHNYVRGDKNTVFSIYMWSASYMGHTADVILLTVEASEQDALFLWILHNISTMHVCENVFLSSIIPSKFI